MVFNLNHTRQKLVYPPVGQDYAGRKRDTKKSVWE